MKIMRRSDGYRRSMGGALCFANALPPLMFFFSFLLLEFKQALLLADRFSNQLVFLPL